MSTNRIVEKVVSIDFGKLEILFVARVTAEVDEVNRKAASLETQHPLDGVAARVQRLKELVGSDSVLGMAMDAGLVRVFTPESLLPRLHWSTDEVFADDPL